MNPTSQSHETARQELITVAVRKLAGELVRLRQGVVTEDEFRPSRTFMGVYGQRQPEQYMVRLRLPYGIVTSQQLRILAEVARTHANNAGHLTTRQAMQLHGVALDAVPGVLERLAQVGITSLQAGGNSVRNVGACPLAGVCRQQIFDVTPYAAAVDDAYVGNPTVQALPRKFKSSFSGCPADCALTAIQDFGAVAVERQEGGTTRRGFRVYGAGGLGSMPRRGMLLEEFVPEDDLLPTYEAVVRLFNRLGDRAKKDRARLKFVVARLGEAEFRRLVQEELAALRSEGLRFPPVAAPEEPQKPWEADLPRSASQEAAYHQWLSWNVVAQQQSGRFSVAIPLPLGDITSEQMEAVAALAEGYGDGALRASNQQNLHLRGVAQERLPEVYRSLLGAELAELRSEGTADVTSCPGTSACSLGITASKGLAREVQRVLRQGGYESDEALGGLRIKISGCPDACGQHYLGDIGLSGAALHQDGRLYPAYILYLGGKADETGTRLAQPVLKLPARRVPAALERLLAFYREERSPGEAFAAFVDRTGVKNIRALLGEYTRVPSADQDPWNFVDWDSTRMYILERGEGECAV